MVDEIYTYWDYEAKQALGCDYSDLIGRIGDMPLEGQKSSGDATAHLRAIIRQGLARQCILMKWHDKKTI